MVLRYTVIVSPRVTAKLAQQGQYIAEQSTRAIAERYIGGLFDYFDGLDTFAERGHPRPDLLPGLQVVGYHAANIAFVVERPHVYVVGVYFGGESYDSELAAIDIDAIKRGAN